MPNKSNGPRMFLPQRRTEELVVEELAEETLVYDLKRHKAHCLNRSAALVWKHCDGTTTTEEMTAILRTELNTPANEDHVGYALDQLQKTHLLDEGAPWHSGTVFSRRAFMRWSIAIGAAVAVPIVFSLVAPRAAYALSCDVNVLCDGSDCGPGNKTRTCNPPPACDCTCSGGGGGNRFCV